MLPQLTKLLLYFDVEPGRVVNANLKAVLLKKQHVQMIVVVHLTENYFLCKHLSKLQPLAFLPFH